MNSVLVVEDDHLLRNNVSSWIKSFGYTVTEAASADEALAFMEHEPIDIALCDVGMASTDGVWLTWRLRERHPRTAIVLAAAIRDC